jgi:[ribosomal protein S5]-alanine N-acetyltransferase
METEKGEGAGGGFDGMTLPVLKTKRLVLRQLVVDDATELFKMLSHEEVMRYWSSGPHQSVDETRSYIEWNADANAEHKCWAVTTDGELAIGWVILLPRRKHSFELGYILSRDQWRRGYLIEAASAVLDYAFRELAVHRVMADTDPDNIASIGLLKKLGFQQEGYLRSEWETHIGVRDSVIFGLLRDEWLARPQQS